MTSSEAALAPLPLDPESLGAVSSPRRSTVIARHPLEPAAATALAEVAAGPTFAASAVASTARGLAPLLEPVPPGPARELLAADLGALLDAFLALTGARAGRARLSVVRRDACRKLHVDRVGLRLLCTYAGPGTDVLVRELDDRSVFAAPCREVDAWNRAVVAWGALEHAVRTGESPFQRANGAPFFASCETDPELRTAFDRAMTSISVGDADAVLKAGLAGRAEAGGA